MPDNSKPSATPRFDGRPCAVGGGHWVRNAECHNAVMRGVVACGLNAATATALDFAKAVGAGPFDCFACISEWALEAFPAAPVAPPQPPPGIVILAHKAGERVRFCYPRAERVAVEARFCSPCGSSACLVTGTRLDLAKAIRDKNGYGGAPSDLIPGVADELVKRIVRDTVLEFFEGAARQ